MMNLNLKRRFLLAGVIPFLCIFCQILLQYNIIFALGGMVNHTLSEWEEWPLLKPENITSIPGTCIDGDEIIQGNVSLHKNGPFPWDAEVEGLINALISAGMMIGMLLTLFVYDYLNGRLVFAVSLAFPGFINVLAPSFAKHGGYLPTAIFRFFTGLYTAILTPVIPSLVNSWFLPTKLFKMNIIIFLGMEFGRMFFCLSGDIIQNFGWEFLFYFPGAMAMLMGFLYFMLMTDDPLENPFLLSDEKKLIAESQQRSFSPATENREMPRKKKLMSQMKQFKKNIKISNARAHKNPIPFKRIFQNKMLYLATLQYMTLIWTTVMMVLMNKEFLEEIHGYSLQESAIMVTIPNNLAQLVIGFVTGFLGDFLRKKNVPQRIVRRMGSIGQILAVIPMLVLPYLPCRVMKYRSAMVLIQVLSSFRVVGNLAGYSSYGDISPTYQAHLYGASSIISQCLPGILVPALMGYFDTVTIDQWRSNYITNCSVVILSNVIYCIFVNADQADFEPGSVDFTNPEEARDSHAIIENLGDKHFVFVEKVKNED